MEGTELIANIINTFFNGSTPSALVELCHAGMLWEAIRREDAHDIETQDILAYLLLHEDFFVLPEILPAIQNGLEPEFIRVKSTELIHNGKDFFWDLVRLEPTYLVSCDFKWMIALTTENTRNGTQLCVIVYAKQ